MAKGANAVPERLINYRVYNDAQDLLGIASVDLPEISAMTDTVSGAGIAGEVDSPVLGHFQSMSVTLNWRTIEPAAMELAEQKAHALELRGSQQKYDAANGIMGTTPVKITLRVMPKAVSLGTFSVGATTDSSSEFEVLYLKVTLDGNELMEIDKYNYVARFGGSDSLASVRSDLGLA